MVRHVNKVEDLADSVAQDLVGKARLLVLVAGVPGAGKSTLVGKVVHELRKKDISAKTLPQDGFHYYRKELEMFPDPPEAFRRRGAPFTFNAEAFVDKVRNLRTGDTVTAPSFDHSQKDPLENDIVIEPEVQVVFIEGNYVGLSDEPWCSLASFTDRLWFIQENTDIVRERLIQRHLTSGVSQNLKEATERCDGSDWQNALYVMEHTRSPDIVITLS